MNNNNSNCSLTKYSGVSAKTGKEYHCYKLTCGKFSTLVFVRSPFERDYLDNYIEKSARDSFKKDMEEDAETTDLFD